MISMDESTHGGGMCIRSGCNEPGVTVRYAHQDAPYALPVCVFHSVEYEMLEGEHARLTSMVERATMAFRSFSECDDETLTPDFVRAEARRTLRHMREIGGVN